MIRTSNNDNHYQIMKQIRNININNFRGLKALALDNLCPITVFLGENSVGKSSVLESLFMATGPNNPFMSLQVTSLRAHTGAGLNEVRYMFYDSDLSNIPQITAVFVDSEFREIRLIPSYTLTETVNADQIVRMGNNSQILTGITSEFVIKKGKTNNTGKSTFELTQDGKLLPTPDSNYQESINSVSLSSYNLNFNLINIYEGLVKSGRKDVILSAIRLFDERINSIEATKDGLFIGYNHLANMVPITMAGDGVQKYLSIALYAFHPSTDIILIDEIENGLHFSAHQKLWECIFTSAKELGKQFFISTHNKETLTCLSSFVSLDDEYSKMLDVITLTRDADTIVPYHLSGYGLSGAIENDIEIRK